MREWFDWFTHMENTKPLALVMMSTAFVGVLLYVFSNRKRSARLETYKYIPLDDDVVAADHDTGTHHEQR
ncbi:MAG: CcoQ/FixQ family Cbb3-type cytochrome c oxidase assembly chaperone [Gammaproteobacteria bacterium]|nr:CcoQ/FixQ family Cbb3-type cytochrome c oxidase assembly chaperone [Gammaproteobacteria bacterium]